MNERINQLRLEAGISRLHDEPKFMVAVSKEGTVIEPLDGLEKFAELIVLECSKVIVNGGYRNPALGEKHPLTRPEIAKMIKEHFGV